MSRKSMIFIASTGAVAMIIGGAVLMISEENLTGLILGLCLLLVGIVAYIFGVIRLFIKRRSSFEKDSNEIKTEEKPIEH